MKEALKEDTPHEPEVVYIPAWLFDAAVARDIDVTGYRKIRPIVQPSARKSGRSEYPACMPAHGGKCAVCGTGDCLRRP